MGKTHQKLPNHPRPQSVISGSTAETRSARPSASSISCPCGMARPAPGFVTLSAAATVARRSASGSAAPLVQRRRQHALAALDAAAENGIPLVVTTSCYSEPHDRVSIGVQS